MPRIELVNVTKTFDEGRVVATDNVSLTIEDGEFIFLLGPSGCGKTTLLKLIAGLHEPTEGHIYIDGKEIRDIPPEERNIGFVFQHFEIFPAMSVFENVAYGLSVRGYSDTAIENIVMSSLSLVNLAHKAMEMPANLSIPEEQKVGLARAIATRSKILFLDEPLGKLDPGLRVKFRHELRDIIKTLGLTAIQVTHDQEEAMSIADRIIVMRQGRILQVGTPQELYYQPRSIFVANFFGETNFLEGFLSEVSETSAIFHLHLGGPKFKINLQEDHKFKNHVQAILAYRVEDVEIFVPSGSEGKTGINGEEYKDTEFPEFNHVAGKLKDSIFVGPYRRFIIELDNGDIVHVKKESKYLYDLTPGSRVIVGFHLNPRTFSYPRDLRNELSKA